MKIHFIGVGGIGVSALAQYYLAKGHQVSGSDLVSSEITRFLKKKGVKIVKKNPKDVDLIIYSPAVSNPPKGKSYPKALGELTKEYFTIAVSGTHGKSTTSAMISLILIKAGLDPTVIIGTKLKEFARVETGSLPGLSGSNFRMGKSKYLIIEADEWQASFLNYWPKIIVLTNIEKEHLDYYKDLKHILKTYKKYIGHLSKNGILVLNKDDKNISKILLRRSGKNRKYSLAQPEAKSLRKILKIKGEHNIYNALAALEVARVLKIPDKISFRALSGYKGAWRRFETREGKIGNKKLTIISDYAHHPTEVRATLEAVRQKFGRTRKKIWCIFQPHQYQRTFYLFNDFVKVFSRILEKIKEKTLLERLIITDIYDVAGREKNRIKKKINSRKLVEEIKKPQAVYLPKERIKSYLKRNLKGGEVIIIMGAGDIYKLAEGFSTAPLDTIKLKRENKDRK